ncbi:MAG: hypothetical protein FRX49_06082 [Trebouxia sp. A1-2]|nr:MAG: hypothetical protein FRX49_06082 [Trebouxia sp. A1-2]
MAMQEILCISVIIECLVSRVQASTRKACRSEYNIGQGDGDSQGQALWHRHHHNGHCKNEELERAGDQQLQGEAAVGYHPPVQRNNGGCEDEVAVRAGSKGKLPFCNVQLCSTTIVTAKTKKLSGPEISSFDGKPPFWIIHLFSARFGDCKCEEAGGVSPGSLWHMAMVFPHSLFTPTASTKTLPQPSVTCKNRISPFVCHVGNMLLNVFVLEVLVLNEFVLGVMFLNAFVLEPCARSGRATS